VNVPPKQQIPEIHCTFDCCHASSTTQIQCSELHNKITEPTTGAKEQFFVVDELARFCFSRRFDCNANCAKLKPQTTTATSTTRFTHRNVSDEM